MNLLRYFSSCSMSCFRYGFHTRMQYSNCGFTSDKHDLNIVCLIWLMYSWVSLFRYFSNIALTIFHSHTQSLPDPFLSDSFPIPYPISYENSVSLPIIMHHCQGRRQEEVFKGAKSWSTKLISERKEKGTDFKRIHSMTLQATLLRLDLTG